MYYYIFDQGSLPVEKFEQLQTQATGLMAEFKISGETARVTPLRSISDLVDTASQRGAKTLVACGSDDTFNLMLAALKGRDFVLGFIPFDENSYLAKILGLDSVFTGVKTIAARRLEKIDLARIAGNYFISYLEFGVMSHNLKNAGFFSSLKMLSVEPKKLQIRIDASYTLNLEALGGLVINTRSTSRKNAKIANPTDSNLDLLILEKLSKTKIASATMRDEMTIFLFPCSASKNHSRASSCWASLSPTRNRKRTLVSKISVICAAISFQRPFWLFSSQHQTD